MSATTSVSRMKRSIARLSEVIAHLVRCHDDDEAMHHACELCAIARSVSMESRKAATVVKSTEAPNKFGATEEGQ